MANDRPPDSSAGVVIADDDDGVRDALGELIDDHPALFLIASVGSGLEAAALCSEHHPPLAVIDVMMPSGGSVAIEAILAASPTTRVMAYIGMAMGLCPPLATIVGGQIHVSFGWQANFVLLVVLCLILLLTGWRYLPDSGTPSSPDGRLLSSLVSAYARLGREPAGFWSLRAAHASGVVQVWQCHSPMTSG